LPAAQISIQSHVSNLRRLLRTAEPDRNQVLASVPPGYQLSVEAPDDAAIAAPADESTVVLLRDKTGRQYRLDDATTRIGRFTDNDVVLDDNDVSRYHAVITNTGTGFVITDLRSTNGVEVRGKRIRGSATVGDGDRIRIGSREFTVEIGSG
jgi:SARP family transcriptional regulator, regulator of embCAB operon